MKIVLAIATGIGLVISAIAFAILVNGCATAPQVVVGDAEIVEQDAGGPVVLPQPDAQVSNGTPEECNGVDDDLNGIVDDLDVAGDGVCDCLRIGVIGELGPWGSGSNVFRDWLNARSQTPAVFLGDQHLTPTLLAPFQVIVVLYVSDFELKTYRGDRKAHHTFALDEISALGVWVSNGGGLFTTAGYANSKENEVDNVNSLLAPLGYGYDKSVRHLDGDITDLTEGDLTAGVSKLYEQNGIAVKQDNGDTFAYLFAAPILQAGSAGEGHVITYGSDWGTYDDLWTGREDLQVERFWLNSLKFLSPANVCQVQLPVPE